MFTQRFASRVMFSAFVHRVILAPAREIDPVAPDIGRVSGQHFGPVLKQHLHSS
ncbi:MAG: hypothetical protein ACI8PT_004871 [Gammaproteobacteria bacterium]|jgi:hypothetical protein